jgi:sugar O-acyltransferase (sialic acid O-acetyltransferase NeuD family)
MKEYWNKISISDREGSRMKNLYVFGAGGHAVSCLNIIDPNHYNIKYFIDPFSKDKDFRSIPIVRTLPLDSVKSDQSLCCLVAIGKNSIRKSTVLEIKDKWTNAVFPSFIHRSAVIGVEVSIGQGVVIMPGAVIGPYVTIGDFSIINTNSNIDHECNIGEFTSISPGVSIAGRVKIESEVFIGIGAVVSQCVTVSANSVIGAQSFVKGNVEMGATYYGTPATRI